MSTAAIDLKNGNIINYKNALYKVVSTEHVKPGKGGAFCQIELKGIENGTKLNERFRSGDKLEKVMFEAIKCQYLYSTGENIELMNLENYEQFSISKEKINGNPLFLQENMIVEVDFADGEPIEINLPSQIIDIIIETATYFKGQTIKSSFKPARISSGIIIQVPDYISEGEKIVVNTIDSSYIERYKGGNN